MPKTHLIAALLGAMITLLALVGHGVATSPEPRCAGDRPLTVIGGRDDSGMRRALITGWRAPDGTKAVFRELPANIDLEHSELVATARSETCAADVYLVDGPWIPEFAQAGYIAPVGIPGGDLAAIMPELRRTGQYRGKLWAVPLNTDAPLLIYRKDLVKDVPRTRADLMAAAGKAASGRRAGLMLQLERYEGFTVNILESIRDHGGDVEVGEDGSVALDRGAVLAALNDLAAGMRRERPPVSPASLDADENDGVDAFERGETAFMRNWPAFYTLLTNREKLRPDQVGAVAYPGARVLGGQSLAIAAGLPAGRARAARALIRHLTGRAQQQRLFACGGWAPVRADAYDADAGGCQVRNKRLVLHADAAVILEAVKGAHPRPSSVFYPEFSGVLQQRLRERLRCLVHPAECPPQPADGEFLDRLTAELERAARGRGR
ncbi:extracellular solute-binding protein [Actinomadura sp. 3N508]|uniref:extracellular solute-binding protein n=1 Tax=Actinomadura sp. 3N508 TaxID=3375153 RepID=UPI003799E0B6